MELTYKMRIVVLWLFIGIAMSAHSIENLSEPNGVESTVSIMVAMGSGGFLFATLVGWLIPLWLAFLTTVLKDTANRWTNIILGIIFTLLSIYHLTEPCVGARIHQILLIASTVVAPALIAWYAWKWPKQDAG